MQIAEDTTRERLSYIDGLRAVAVIGVVLCHAEMGSPIKGYHAWIEGGHGVDLFFVISGFCLSYPTLRKFILNGKSEFDLVRFATHRVVRIMPPYYLATLLLLFVALLSRFLGGSFAPPGTLPLHPGDIVSQFLLVDRAVRLASPPYWTLLVELRWYILFPALLALWIRAPRAFIASAVLIFIAYFFTRAHSLDAGALPAFMLGIVAADMSIRNHALCKYAPQLAIAGVGIALLIEPYNWTPNEFGVDQNFLIWQANPGWYLAAFALVIAAGRVLWLRRLLSIPVVAFLGVASYSIYLMHYPIIVAIETATRGAVPAFLASVVAAVIGGVLFYFAVEQWFCGGFVRARLYAEVEPRLRFAHAWLERKLPSSVLRSANATGELSITTVGPKYVEEALRIPESR
jgi:peptidoglycan/LPS O-acetylase OafA/YrhL